MSVFFTFSIDDSVGGYPLKLFVRGMTIEDDSILAKDINIPYLEDGVIDMDKLVFDVSFTIMYDVEIKYSHYLIYNEDELTNKPYESVRDTLMDLLGEYVDE
jgi:hypothetical protein